FCIWQPAPPRSNSQQSCGTYRPVCGKQATLLGDTDESRRMGGNRPTGWNVKGPAIRAWGKYHSRVIGRAANTGRSKAPQRKRPCRSRAAARRSLDLRGRQQVAFVVALPHAAEPPPSRASLNGLDGINFFNAAMLAGFGPYVAVYLAEQKWPQENIGFVLTASGLAGLLALMPGG